MNCFCRRLWVVVVGTAVSLFAIIFLSNNINSTYANSDSDDFGYGLSVAWPAVSEVQAMGFNWIRVFDPPNTRHPVNVLLRVDINAGHLNDINGFGDSIQALAQSQKGYVNAYELGNEVNLDASYGWAAPPNAAQYATLLCEAYGRVKAVDPDVIVVSAGLAPVGRVSGNWHGHPGHNGAYQDDREYMKEFLDAGGGACFDVFGYHPFGYSADFDAPPDQWSADPTQNCTNGFCFRGLEKIYEILQSRGLGHKQIWGTEYGWLTMPPDQCTNDGSWDGRFWQIVSDEKQAENLMGSFLYAREHYPWIGALFIFNYNFNEAGWYGECEQMRYYSIKNRLAQTTLAEMPKIANPEVGELLVQPPSFTRILSPDQQPFSITIPFTIENEGDWRRTYEIEVGPNTEVDLNLSGPLNGNLYGRFSSNRTLQIETPIYPPGNYSNTIQITDTVPGLGSSDTQTIPINIFIWEETYQTHLPIVMKQ